MILIFFFILLLIPIWLMIMRFVHLLKRRNFLKIYNELFVPGMLILLYGIGGIFAFSLDVNERSEIYGINYSDLEVLFSYFIMLLAAVMFWVGVNIGPFNVRSRIGIVEKNTQIRRKAIFMISPLLLLDLFVRMQKIQSGVYFSWMKGRASDMYDVTASPLWLLGDKLSPIIFSIFIFLALSKKRWYLISLAYAFLLMVAGSRTMLFLTLISGFFTWMQFSNTKLALDRFLKLSILVVLFFNILSSAIIEVRGQYRANIKVALENPSEFTNNIATTYIPNALNNALNPFSKNEENVNNEILSTSERLALNSISYASQLNVLLDSSTFLPKKQFIDELLISVPSIIYPNKVANTFGHKTNKHLGVSGSDPATTIFSSISNHFFIPGVIIFAFFVGLSWSIMSSLLINLYGNLGLVIWFGGIIAFEIGANSFGMFFNGIRDYIIILVLMFIFRILATSIPTFTFNLRKHDKN